MLFKELNNCHALYPQSHPQCVQVEAITIRILEALQRESGMRHKLADREWVLNFDGTIKVVKKRREQNVRSTTAGLKDGINWEFFVVDNPISRASHICEGIIIVFSGSFDAYKTDDELAITIATQVGNIVARHIQREFGRSPCLLYHRLINHDNPKKHYLLSHELEADYIGMLLSASAGYDPRVAPVALQKTDSEHRQFHFMEERIKHMTQPEVMQKAVDIYEGRRKGRAII
ncbi:mitochondrial metalloendopeptidase OMA1-like isoform X1 [Daucus carota subsp. sativus]|uniref:mitochondrial metalloendopeptidase OMA1-like isoform X1 n=2 Tax=Daucus carota subsp. sativus TaxID=79200 RepID=UPI0030827AA5